MGGVDFKGAQVNFLGVQWIACFCRFLVVAGAAVTMKAASAFVDVKGYENGLIKSSPEKT